MPHVKLHLQTTPRIQAKLIASRPCKAAACCRKLQRAGGEVNQVRFLYSTATQSSAAPTSATGRVVRCQAAADGAGAGAVTGAVAGVVAGEAFVVLGAAAGVADVDAGVAAGAPAA